MNPDEPGRPDPPGPPDASTTPDEPQVLAVKRDEQVWRMGKREFLKRAVLGAVAGAAACKTDKDDNAVPPFAIGGMTYRLIALPDYNAELPQTGTSLSVVGFVDADFYFRAFNPAGQLVVNLHESKATDPAALGDLKRLSQTVAARGSAEPAEQTRFAELFATTTGTGPRSGRRMQGTTGEVGQAGRRMQGSASTGTITGRRMQGAEGRMEGSSAQRNLGTLRVNHERYNDARIVATYDDGYTKLTHADGEAVVRTDALPEIVRMQLPMAIGNPSPLPTAVPRTEVVPAPSPPPRSTYGGHYWRPN